RAEAFPESLWTYDDDALIRVDPSSAAKALGREHVVAVPPSPQNRATLGATVLAPKMKLADGDATVMLTEDVWTRSSSPGSTRRVRVESVIADALHEIADFYLPRAGLIADALYPRLVLTHPTRFGAEQRAALRRAAQPMARRLGLEAEDDGDLVLVAESDAVAAHYLNKLSDDARPNVRAVVYDLGGGTLDLSLVEANRTAPQHGQRAAKAVTLARGGAEVGGDTIDLVLYFIIAAALERLGSGAQAIYQHDLTAPAKGQRAHLSAKRQMAWAIHAAKADLTEQCRAASRDGDGPGHYHWPENVPFRVQVGAVGGQATDWPVRERDGGSLRRHDELLGRGLTLKRDGDAIVLEMSKSAVERPAMVELMRFMTRDVLDHLFNRGRGEPRHREADTLIVSGRASLWPLIYEGLAAALTDGGIATEFAQVHPDTETALKGAVTLGAISCAADLAAGHEVERTDPAHYAILVSEIDFDGTEHFQQLVPERSFPEMRGYSGYMRLVEVPPGLTVRALNASPWARSLIAPTGIGADPRDLSLADTDASPSFTRRPDGRVELQIGSTSFQVDGSRFGHAPALHRAQFDVTSDLLPQDVLDGVTPESGAARPAVSKRQRGETGRHKPRAGVA
ncbi:MAG: hypothetical protein AAFV62_07935, partial [Pseudomonadota bacterium]